MQDCCPKQASKHLLTHTYTHTQCDILAYHRALCLSSRDTAPPAIPPNAHAHNKNRLPTTTTATARHAQMHTHDMRDLLCPLEGIHRHQKDPSRPCTRLARHAEESSVHRVVRRQACKQQTGLRAYAQPHTHKWPANTHSGVRTPLDSGAATHNSCHPPTDRTQPPHQLLPPTLLCNKGSLSEVGGGDGGCDRV